MTVDTQQVLAELQRITTSPGFRARKLIKKFLHYVVQESLAGRGNQLNQYTIAVNALDKSADFSPIYNPMVRIEAGRLRKLLDDYYSNVGHLNTVMIRMPKGSYQVEFQACTSQPLAYFSDEVQHHISEGPRLFVHFQMLHADHNNVYPLLYKVRGDLLLILSRFRNIRLVSSASMDTGHPLSGQRLCDVWDIYRADYLLTCDVNPGGGTMELCFSLAHTQTNETVWRGTIALPTAPCADTLQAMYRQITANTVSLHCGLMLQHWAQHWHNSMTNVPGHHQVLVAYLHFLRAMSLETFTQVLQVCRQRLKYFPHDSKALVIFARLCAFDGVLQYRLIKDRDQLWTQSARLAMKLDVGNAEAHSVFAHNSYMRGDYALCRAELDVAQQANPFDLSGEYLRGIGLCMLGDWDAGVALIQQLMQVPCNKPDWYYVLPFLYAFNRGDYLQALAHAEHIQQFGYWGELARCVSCYHLGHHARAQTEWQCLQQKYPDLLRSERLSNSRFLSDPAFQSLWRTLHLMICHHESHSDS
ncbi:tetratricopeptide repeat protein [Candidatus Thiothrix anitrata]|uniref:Tetratricopeptide repeat protein n=1 Tax=Candidatus Thiothrix anitrata TaxID=2823902 RepID=A0ABX7X757_9GAMM|nr:hypothetical protein [Candidatus Thiothrix anitrata]QTR50768.1 hypothetical protein J8380_04145 [Candidatus Thiothrix anitrata]